MSLPAVSQSRAIVAPVPQSLPEMLSFADVVVRSGLSLGHKSKESVVIALQSGLELGLQPMQALRMVNVIKGKPSLSADGCVAVVLNSGLAEYFHETENTGKKSTWATKRRGSPSEKTYTFTIEMARAAKLTGSEGQMYEKYPERMLAARAKKYLAQDIYPDVIGGMLSTEELEAITEKDAGGGEKPGGAPPSAKHFPAPRRASEQAAATEEAADESGDGAEAEPAAIETTATGAPLELTGQSDEERYGKIATQKEIGSMMGALDKAGVPSDRLKEYMLARWGLSTRKELRRGHLLEIAEWLKAGAPMWVEREPGQEG